MVQPRFLSVAILMSLASGAMLSPVQKPPFEEDILKFEAEDKANPPVKGGVVFVGSSSIRLWKTLASDFPKHHVVNRGFGGSQMSDSVRYAHRIVTPYEPKMIFVFAGTNDIAAGKSPEQVRDDFRAFVGRVRQKLPKVPIRYIAITPAPARWDKIEEVRGANRLVREFTRQAPHLVFVDTFRFFVDDKSGPRPDLFVGDRLHLSEKGYAVWKREVGRYMPRA